MIVMKFGGTSVESAAAIERVAGIVRAREERRPVVVVSARSKTSAPTWRSASEPEPTGLPPDTLVALVGVAC